MTPKLEEGITLVFITLFGNGDYVFIFIFDAMSLVVWIMLQKYKMLYVF